MIEIPCASSLRCPVDGRRRPMYLSCSAWGLPCPGIERPESCLALAEADGGWWMVMCVRPRGSRIPASSIALQGEPPSTTLAATTHRWGPASQWRRARGPGAGTWCLSCRVHKSSLAPLLSWMASRPGSSPAFAWSRLMPRSCASGARIRTGEWAAAWMAL